MPEPVHTVCGVNEFIKERQVNNRIPEGMSVRIYGVGTGMVSGPENRMVRRIGYSHITGCRHKLLAAEYQSSENNPGRYLLRQIYVPVIVLRSV